MFEDFDNNEDLLDNEGETDAFLNEHDLDEKPPYNEDENDGHELDYEDPLEERG